MLTSFLALFGLYAFAIAGFVLKKIFKDELSAKPLGITTIYFFQPILVFWGFTNAKLQWEILHVGIFHFLTGAVVAGLLFLLVSKTISDTKTQALVCFTGTCGNTGNIGVPLSGIFFGPIGIVVATMINVWNVLWSFSVGVFFYARGNFSIAKSLVEIIKMPLVWASFLGIAFNIFDISFSEKMANFLEMGAHTSIATQLLLLGIFIAGVERKNMDFVMSGWIGCVKFFLFPVVGIGILWAYSFFFGELPREIFLVAVIELLVPLATTNGNLSLLYQCHAQKVSEAILVSYLLFLILFPFFVLYNF